MNSANFGPVADGADVYGACRPGHLGGGLDDWTSLLDAAGVSTVVCLLSDSEAARWGVPSAYEGKFETLHLPIRDRTLPEPEGLARALDAVEAATDRGEGAVVHCNAGLGRTGVVGAGWLVRAADHAPGEAVAAVESASPPRAPREAVRDGAATERDLLELLSTV